MTNKEFCGVLVIGAGPGGLAAAKSARESGAESVIVLERNTRPGGILNQCIHDGFGLIRYGKALTGPEYASLALSEALSSGAKILTGHHVTAITPEREVTAYSRSGIRTFCAKSIVLATGCRERTRGAISIPGDRPAGVFTAGVVQELVNVRNIMPGKRVVILGSGDIGLIMARRLTLEGAQVLAAAEILPSPCGLARNVSQCLYEFGIPLYVSTTVTRIIGRKKLEAVELSDVDADLKPIAGTERVIECDCLVLSVGLIPENEIAKSAGVRLNPDNSVRTDEFLQTSVPGIFSCGNSRHVMDLADYVSEQAELAGTNAVRFINGGHMLTWDEEKTNCMKKGFPDKDTITCTVCPNGCQIKYSSGTYSGSKCARGIAFAEQERTSPRRTVTTTIRRKDGVLLPVRTAGTGERVRVIPMVTMSRGMEFSGSEVLDVDGETLKVSAV